MAGTRRVAECVRFELQRMRGWHTVAETRDGPSWLEYTAFECRKQADVCPRKQKNFEWNGEEVIVVAVGCARMCVYGDSASLCLWCQ